MSNTSKSQTPPQIEITIGAKIKKIRLELGLGQLELLGGRYSKTYLSRIEHDQVLPSYGFLIHLTQRINSTVEELIKDTNYTSPKRISREYQEVHLVNAEQSIEVKQFNTAKTFLDKLDISKLSLDLLPRYYRISGEIKVGQKEYSEALTDLGQALELLEADSTASPLEIEQVRYQIGLIYYYQQEPYLAIKQHLLCLESLTEKGIINSEPGISVYLSLAEEYSFVGEYAKSLDFYQQAISLAEKRESQNDLAKMYWGMGTAYYKTGNVAQADLYLTKSAEEFEDNNRLKEAIRVRGELSNIQIEQEYYQEAEVTLQKALEIASPLKDDELWFICYLNLAYLYYKQVRLEQAELNAKQAVTKAETLNNKLLLGRALRQLADIKIAQADNDSGLSYFEKAVSALEQTEATEDLEKVYLRYATVREEMGQLSEAIKLYRQAYEFQHQKKSRPAY